MRLLVSASKGGTKDPIMLKIKALKKEIEQLEKQRTDKEKKKLQDKLQKLNKKK